MDPILRNCFCPRDTRSTALIRRASTFNTGRIDHVYTDPHVRGAKLFLHYGDLADSGQLTHIIYNIKPDEVYNLAAQSHVRVSFDMPEYTGDIVGLGTTRLLESIHRSGIKDTVLSGLLFGNVRRRKAAPERKDHLLSPQPLCGGQGLCLLDHGQLPGRLQSVRLQRHPVQP